jgi:methionine-gamma-lyase
MPVEPRPELHPRTRAVHHPAAVIRSDPLAAPLVQSATFRLPDAAAGAGYAEEVHPSSFYTRWGNPTTEVWEKVVADLEGAERGLAFASGMAAISTTLLALLRPGDHVVAANSLYAATTELLNRELRALGIEVTFVDPADPERFVRAVTPRTRLFYVETPDNPNVSLTDIAAVAESGRGRGVLTVADNTFASPINQNPLSLGADLVLHSATKYLSGHSDVIAGCAVGGAELVDRIWRVQKLLGGCLDPHAAWLLLRGAKTLAVRVERHNENAARIAAFLEGHPQVARVRYPGLASHPQHALARRQMRGYGGMLSFELKGGRAAGLRLVESTRLMVLAVSLGGVETLIEHPASMTHAPLDDQELARAGISPGLIRLSVGIEDGGDLIDDLERALAA